VRTEICGQRNGGAEGEEHAQCVHGDINDGDAELVDKGRGDEVDQRQEPPQTHKERVVDDAVGSVVGAINVVGHEGHDEDGANKLSSY